MAGVLTPLGRAYSSLERDMIAAFALSSPDLIVCESPKDTPDGVFAPMDGVVFKCNGPSIEIAYIYEAKTRNFNAAKLFGRYGGKCILGSAKLGNCQRASLLFRVPSLIFIRLQSERFYLVKRVCNPDGTFTFRWNQTKMRTRIPCGLGGYENVLQTYVPMNDARRMPL